MVRGAFTCIYLVKQHLLKQWENSAFLNYFFQKDNAQFNLQNTQKNMCFENDNIPTFHCPVNNPDLNHMDNIGGIIVRDIYLKNAQMV